MNKTIDGNYTWAEWEGPLRKAQGKRKEMRSDGFQGFIDIGNNDEISLWGYRKTKLSDFDFSTTKAGACYIIDCDDGEEETLAKILEDSGEGKALVPTSGKVFIIPHAILEHRGRA